MGKGLRDGLIMVVRRRYSMDHDQEFLSLCISGSAEPGNIVGGFVPVIIPLLSEFNGLLLSRSVVCQGNKICKSETAEQQTPRLFTSYQTA